MNPPTVLDPSSPRIRRAMAAVREAVPIAERDPSRPAFHFRPLAGWMNDPNGTLHHRGRYHLFYQHHPFGDEWGAVHWGHASSPDLVRWEHLPIALAPSTERGEAHCFSGCAWKDPAGRPVLLYSSFPPPEAERPAEQRAVRADHDLLRFEKLPGNAVPLPRGPGAPRFGPEWRDPFVFEEEGRTFLILGVTLPEEENAPAVALWEAEDDDPPRWGYRGLLHRGRGEAVEFFECPNLLRIGDRHLLVYSAHRPVTWLLGCFSPETGRFREDSRGRVDHGSSFYATSPFVAEPRGRIVLVGWVRGWSAGRGWNGVLSLPRVLTPGPDGLPRQRPLPELARLRGHGRSLSEQPLDPGSIRPLEGLESNTLEFRAELGLGSGGESGGPAATRAAGGLGIRLRRAGDGEPLAEIRLLGPEGPVHVSGRAATIDLRAGRPPTAGTPAAGVSTRVVEYLRRPEEPFRLHGFWDRSLLEVFLDDGRAVCTEVLDMRGEPVRVEAFAADAAPPSALGSLEAWRLEPIW